jgi:hypothetical protein
MNDIRRAAPKSKILNRDPGRFGIAGRDYRLIAAFDFRRQIAFLKFIGMHAEYNAIDALTVAREASMQIRPITAPRYSYDPKHNQNGQIAQRSVAPENYQTDCRLQIHPGLFDGGGWVGTGTSPFLAKQSLM